jgi:hypothetical protein
MNMRYPRVWSLAIMAFSSAAGSAHTVVAWAHQRRPAENLAGPNGVDHNLTNMIHHLCMHGFFMPDVGLERFIVNLKAQLNLTFDQAI